MIPVEDNTVQELFCQPLAGIKDETVNQNRI